jgi:hypothetical protein
MRRARPAMVAAGVILVASAIFAQEVGYLDLTDPAPRQRIHSPTGGGTGGFCVSGGGDFSAMPEITVSLSSMDKLAYSIGEEVTFEVKIQNTGRHGIEIPWTRHLGDLEPSDPTQSYTYRTAVLLLTLKDPTSHDFLTLGEHFYGSSDVRGSIRELLPSQSIVIRARKQIEPYDAWLVSRTKEVQPLLLKASANLMFNEMTYTPNNNGDLGSENTRCIPVNAKIASPVDILLWPRSQ